MLQYFIPLTGYPYQGAMVDCPVCGSDSHSQITNWDRRVKRLATHLCDHCGLFFTNPMPTAAELDRYYSKTYRIDYQFAFFKPGRKHRRRKQREAARRAARMDAVIGLDGPRRYLDFGCGSGELVRQMEALGHAAHGFEQGATYGEFARAALDAPATGAGSVRVGAWREMDYAPKTFDIISCLHVLEHLNEPMPALRRVHSWLSDDGVFYLEAPDMQDRPIKGFDCFHFAHVLGFSRDTLMYALGKAGFALLYEDGPTSLFLVKAGAAKGRPFTYDLKRTAAKNRADYSTRVTLEAYAKRHFRRIKRLLGENTVAAR